MTTSRQFHPITPGQKAVEEAARWLVEAADGELDLESRHAFSQWLCRSPDNIAAYLEVAAFWSDVPQAAPSGGFDIASLIEKAKTETVVVALGTDSAETAVRPKSVAQDRRSPRWRRYATVTALVSLVGAGVWGIQFWRGETIATEIGEQRSVTLADGSTVELNARTRLRVRMGDEIRSVTLEEGQAIFTVFADAERPFVVTSGEIQVRAIGTQFDVDRRPTRTTVTVLEGVVAVGGSQVSSDVKLTAGHRIVVRGIEIDPAQAVDIASATAWTDRRLVFQATPLGSRRGFQPI